MNIQDVAKLANVSVATVSRVLNNTANVTEQTKQKVLDAIESLNYYPNLVGRNLRRKETKLALIIMNSIVNSFFVKIVKGIEDRAMSCGYNTMICTTDNDANKIAMYLDLLNSRLADGAILLGIGVDDTIKRLIKSAPGVPLIQCCEYEPTLSLPYVCIDDEKAAFDAVTALLKDGRKKILHISCENTFSSTINRLRGYQRALKAYNVPFDPKLVLHGNYGYRNAMHITQEFLEQHIPFDAILANSDRMAAGAMHVLLKNGVSVPNDVAVIGFDNTDLCYMHTPSITSVSQSQYHMGETAFQMLYDKLTKDACATHKLIDHELVFRDSTVNKS